MWTPLEPKFENCVSYWKRAMVRKSDATGAVLLASYGTIVCFVDARGGFHRSWSGWSRTTSRHVVEFWRQFCGHGAVPNKAAWLGLPVESPEAAAKARDDLLSPEARA